MVSHPLFIECVVREKVEFYGRGILNEPSNWMQFVRYAHGELDSYNNTYLMAQAKKKRPQR